MSVAENIRRQQTVTRLRRLGFGFCLAGDVLILYQLATFLLHLDAYPRLPYSVAAWVLLLAGAGFAQWAQARYSVEIPAWVLPAIVLAWIIVVSLDLTGSWSQSPPGGSPAAAIAVGAGLLLVVTHAQPRTVVITATLLAAAIVGSFLLQRPHDILQLAPMYLTLALAAAPAILAVLVMRSLNTVARLELDRVQAQSTVQTPGFTVGMLASEELARLDLDAEHLLDGVATGRTPLPLSPHTASAAASLATELRLHLIEGRRETWLYHAVSESAFLGPVVSLNDPDGLAGLLDSDQRDGLLSAAWLLLSDPQRAGQSLHIVMSSAERSEAATPDPTGPLVVPISILATGVPRKGVDPATWHAVGKVGRYTEAIRDSVLLIEIECVVDNPADYESEPLVSTMTTTKGRT